MSTGAEQEDVASSVDRVLPEDGVEITKVKRLEDLSKVALANSTQMRALQRRLVGCREAPEQANLIEPLENAIALRQQRGIRLVNHRTALQNKENVKKRNALEEALRPTVGALNNDKRTVMNQMIDLCDRIKEMRGKYTEHTADQRRLEARLKQWESSLTAMIMGLDKLAPLPTDLE